MKTFELKGAQKSTNIYLDAAIDYLADLTDPKKIFLVTDKNIYGKLHERFPAEIPTFQVLPGEYSKSLRVATLFYRWLQEHGADRQSSIVAIGGGTVCDLAGYVASTYMRGVGLAMIPTTLLAQVDAAIGGKNALNLYGFKNIVGTFYNPDFVLIDYSLLRSLPAPDVNGGLAEIIKHTIIGDEKMFRYMGENAGRALALDMSVIPKLVEWSVRFKAKFVEMDEYDQGERRKLNLGHTWGHAVEGVTGLHHGHCVAIGMLFAAQFAHHKGLCNKETVTAIREQIARFQLPQKEEVLPWVIYDAMLKDKKKETEAINFIFPKRIGEVTSEKVAFDEIKEFIEIRDKTPLP